MVKLSASGGLLVSCVRSVFHTARHLHMPSLPRFTNELQMSTLGASKSDCSAPWQHRTPKLGQAVLHEVEEDVMTCT